MIRCQLCNGETSWTRDYVEFVTDVSAHLCVDCENKVSQKIAETPEYRESELLKARDAHYRAQATAHNPPTLEEWNSLFIELGDVHNRLRPKILEFVKPPVSVQSQQ